ncbi:MAG: serine hydroxymethyltransferase [Desulfosarcinaceae bacterium]
MKSLLKDDPEIAAMVGREAQRIEDTIDLIAAENHPPRSILEVLGSVLHLKTIEGYPGKRFHAGCAWVDQIEAMAISRAKALFGAEHANVQPLSGTAANLAVYFSVLRPGDRILSMGLAHGGHLSHGHRASITGKCFSFKHYAVDSRTERIDYGHVRRLALDFRPKMIVAGASSYPRLIEYDKMAAIAKEVDAVLLADMAHLAGLVAARVIPSPVPHCDFVTFTCYKTMAGCRGGVILARQPYARKIDAAVFPGCQGTSPVDQIAAKAVIFEMATTNDYIHQQQETVRNAVRLSAQLARQGYRSVSGGTDNHQVLLDLTAAGLDGATAESALEAAGIIANRNVIPRDADDPGATSGLRLGTAAVTARGMGEDEMARLAALIGGVLKHPADEKRIWAIGAEVKAFARQFPVYA